MGGGRRRFPCPRCRRPSTAMATAVICGAQVAWPWKGEPGAPGSLPPASSAELGAPLEDSLPHLLLSAMSAFEMRQQALHEQISSIAAAVDGVGLAVNELKSHCGVLNPSTLSPKEPKMLMTDRGVSRPTHDVPLTATLLGRERTDEDEPDAPSEPISAAEVLLDPWEKPKHVPDPRLQRVSTNELWLKRDSPSDPYGTEKMTWKTVVGRIEASPMFEYASGAVVATNAALVGWQVSRRGTGEDLSVAGPRLEQIFLVFYATELAVRFTVEGRALLSQTVVQFDVAFVFLGAALAVSPLFGDQAYEYLEVLRVALILRIFRLYRLLRALRLFPQFRLLWKLVQGLMDSMTTVLSTMPLLMITAYVFGCIGVEIIANNEALRDHPDPLIQELVHDNFSRLSWAMLTLVQFVTLDDTSQIYAPLVRERWWLFLYFLPILLIVSIALVNLVTAVLVEACLALSRTDQEMERAHRQQMLKKLVPDIRRAFHQIDDDNSGTITQDEIMNAADHLPTSLAEIVKPGEVLEFFEALDVDGSGELEENEFVDGVVNLAMSDLPMATHQTLKLLRVIQAKVTKLEMGAS